MNRVNLPSYTNGKIFQFVNVHVSSLCVYTILLSVNSIMQLKLVVVSAFAKFEM